MKIKVFSEPKEYWERGSPSQKIETEYGPLSLRLNVMRHIDEDNPLPNGELIFPYGLKSISHKGELNDEHLYFLAFIQRKVKNPDEHFSLKVYLSGLKKGENCYVGFDSSCPTLDRGEWARFPKFMLEGDKPIEEKEDLGGVWVTRAPTYGLLVIPRDLSLIKEVEISIDKIPKEKWEEAPWEISDLVATVHTEMEGGKELTDKHRGEY